MRGQALTALFALLAVGCTEGTTQPIDVGPRDVSDLDMPVDSVDGFDVAGEDVGPDAADVPAEDVVELFPDYPEAWDIPELDISDEALAAYRHVYTPTGSFPLVIPDHATAGVDSSVEVTDTGSVAAVGVYLAVRHPARGDLRVSITSAEGTRVRLHNHSGGSEDDILTFYPDLTEPEDGLSRLMLESVEGTWTLNAADDYSGNVGQLEDWALYLNF